MFRRSLSLLPLLLLATPALAADKVDPKIKADFDKTDTNHDGFLTRAEVDARVARMDVGKAKMPAGKAKAIAGAWFNTADANHDGKVSPAEMQGLFRALASRYDTNHDGVISLDERAAARAAVLGGAGAGPVGR
ncbi:EF-hand domain-containing protein [Sphingomonas sp. RP10(2022)]|uniref:EF-hand domain-containing protein n=1 Tax=Sphingomonas liriopis TaxID=2949094 RepID=A0A9X2KPV3_9SPHN|nr:EF-hand domain-containing protein [Sphingomonas liriopis]MCP3735069.1 EF-hand domain-containing protein [Sphingomonas liriopis]